MDTHRAKYDLRSALLGVKAVVVIAPVVVVGAVVVVGSSFGAVVEPV